MIDDATSFATICDEIQSCHGVRCFVMIIAETVVTMMTMVWLVSPSWAELSCHQAKTRPTITVRNCYLTQQHARARSCPKIIIFWQSGCRIVFAVSFLGRMLLTMPALWCVSITVVIDNSLKILLLAVDGWWTIGDGQPTVSRQYQYQLVFCPHSVSLMADEI